MHPTENVVPGSFGEPTIQIWSQICTIVLTIGDLVPKEDGMRKFWVIAVAVVAVSSLAFAQTTAGAQSSGSAAVNSEVQTGAAGSAVNSGASAATQSGVNAVTDSGKAAAGLEHSAHAAKQVEAANPAAANAAGSTAIQAVLTKTVDVKKAKVGDEVVAKTTHEAHAANGAKIPKGSKLFGHVTEAKAKTKGSAESTLGVIFDKAVLKNGQEVQINALIKAVAPPAQVVSAADLSTMTSASPDMGSAPRGGNSGGGGLLGGVTNTVGSATGMVGNTIGGVGSAAGSTIGGATSATGSLTASSSGVFGLKNIQLSNSTSGSAGAQGSLLTSTSGNVRLESGTQLVLSSSQE